MSIFAAASPFSKVELKNQIKIVEIQQYAFGHIHAMDIISDFFISIISTYSIYPCMLLM
jgi:hypothetical protein